MSTLTWDNVGDHIYQFGIDRGVLYLVDGTAVAWNGLTGLDESSDSERKTFYLDGVKFLETVTPGDFLGTLKAFTYPDEFDDVMGIASEGYGLSFHEQPHKSFGLTYRTLIGDDESQDRGYRIHILYNLNAIPESHSYTTLQEQAQASEFSWTLSGVPPRITGFRPTVHISVDSTNIPESRLTEIENVLYGTETTDPRLPDIAEMRAMVSTYGDLVITDNGDGSWSAVDVADDIDYITYQTADEFAIEHANAVYLDPDTFQITTTDAPLP